MADSKPKALLAGGARLASRLARWGVTAANSLVEEVRRRKAGSSSSGASPPPADGVSPPPATGSPGATPRAKVPEPNPQADPQRAPDGEPATGFPEPPGKDPGDISHHASPHHALNNPLVDDPDPTEWPDPYEQREDPRDPADPDGEPFGAEPHPQSGSISTSEPHPSQDPEAGDRWEAPKRDKLDD
ncbi:MAG TPA: hypothetical protein VGO36_01815 [Solirubrobacterales bacterium]|jgi:hypothetical protein|nr:hypothetical protein [Solirubrobacterales bacterium]